MFLSEWLQHASNTSLGGDGISPVTAQTHSKTLGLPPLDCGLQSLLPLGQFGDVDILQHLHVQVPGDLHRHGLQTGGGQPRTNALLL